MKVMSFNTQHCLNFKERFIDYPLMAQVILDAGADLVGLNEMRGQGSAEGYEDQTGILAELTGMEHYFAQALGFDGFKPYGNGLLSKLPIASAETILIPDPKVKCGPKNYETRCLMKAKLPGDITLLVTHMGLNMDEQANAVQAILEHMSQEKCIVMGDFNATPLCPVLAPLFEVFVDVSDRIPGDQVNTFPSDAPDRKIDYILVTPDVQVLDAQVLPIVASDHCPHSATLSFD